MQLLVHKMCPHVWPILLGMCIHIRPHTENVHMHMHTHMYLFNQPTSDRNSPAWKLHNHQNALQGEEGEFDAQPATVEKKLELIGLHLNGTKEAKSKYEAMLA